MQSSFPPIKPPPYYLRKSVNETLACKHIYDHDEHGALGTLRLMLDSCNDDDFQLTDVHLEWLRDDACLYRYLRATSFKVKEACTMIINTLKWRDERGVWDLSSRRDMIEHEGATGKSFRLGHDKLGRPVIYTRDREQNTKDYESQVLYFVHVLEQAIATMDLSQRVETWTMVMDFRGRNSDNTPPMRVAKEVLSIFQCHYPERLGVAYMIDSPWMFWAFFKLISPFLDPETKAKAVFVDGTYPPTPGGKKAKVLGEGIELDVLSYDYGGNNEVDWNGEAFFRAEREMMRQLEEHEKSLKEKHEQGLDMSQNAPKEKSKRKKRRK